MSFVKIWVHIVFATKNRAPLLEKGIRDIVYKHIRSNCREKEIFLKSIGGYTDHLHCLISLGKEQTIAKVAQLIKGESAYWINEQKLSSEYFGWQDDYFAVSVSESQVLAVINYIDNQEMHHSKKSFGEEADEFVKKYGFEKVKG